MGSSDKSILEVQGLGALSSASLLLSLGIQLYSPPKVNLKNSGAEEFDSAQFRLM
jgi:hypothetical protein